MSPGCNSDVTSNMSRFGLSRSNSIAGITKVSREAVSKIRQRRRRCRPSPYEKATNVRSSRGRVHREFTMEDIEAGAISLPFCSSMNSDKDLYNGKWPVTKTEHKPSGQTKMSSSSAVNEVSKLFQTTLSFERCKSEKQEAVGANSETIQKDQEFQNSNRSEKVTMDTGCTTDIGHMETFQPAHTTSASRMQGKRSPLTPCIPHQLPFFQMPSPKTIKNTHNREQWHQQDTTPKRDLQIGTTQEISELRRDLELKRTNSSGEMRCNDRSREMQTHSDNEDEDDKDTPLVCVPKFFEELVNDFANDQQVFGNIVESMNRITVEVPEDIEIHVHDLRKKDTVILEREDKENNAPKAEDKFTFKFLDGTLQFPQQSLFDSSPEQSDSETFETEKTEIIEQLLQLLSQEHSMENSDNSPFHDERGNQEITLVSSYRDLLSSSSHFTCIVCDANLETLPPQRFDFDFENGEFPGSHLEKGGHQVDLFCPVCCCRRSGYNVSRIPNNGQTWT